MGLDFSVLSGYYGVLAEGAWWTIALTVLSVFFSLVVGVLMALARLSRFGLVRRPVAFLVWLFMGTPLLLQLYLIYFGLDQIGIALTAFASGVIGLSLHYAVYAADIMRAGIVAVDKGQYEASRSLGLSHLQAMRKTVVPQALYSVTPALGNLAIALLKDTALVSVIGVMELTLSAQRGISDTYRPFEFYIAAAVIYYILNLVLEWLLGAFEMRSARYR